MESRKRITEEDLLVTEALIAESCGRLKKSVCQVPARALGSIGSTISRHPLETAALAVGGGVAAYGVARMLTPDERGNEHKKQHRKKKKAQRRYDPVSEIVSAVIPLAIPYITGYLEKYLGLRHEKAHD
jgi:hypothetical protein